MIIIYHGQDNPAAFDGGHTWFWFIRPIQHNLLGVSSGAVAITTSVRRGKQFIVNVGRMIGR